MPTASTPQQKQRLSVLVIEDNPADYELIVATLEKAGYGVDGRRVDRQSQLGDLAGQVVDVVLCDHGLPDMDVAVVMQRLRDSDITAPVIVVTGTMDDEQAVNVIKLGAHDYLLKDRLARLPASVEQALDQRRLATAQREAAQRLNQLSGMTSALRMVSSAISSSTDVKVTLSVLLDQVVQVLGVDAAAVFLLQKRARRLEYAQGRGFRTEQIKTTRMRMGDGVGGAAVTRMETVIVNGASDALQEFANPGLVKAEGFTGVVATPLLAKGRPIGLLEVFSRSSLDWSPEREEALQAMATAAAIAVDNATLLESAQRKSMELEQTYVDTLEGWAAALELRDYETEGHCRRVTELSEMIGREMSLEDSELGHLTRGALLHDIGKMAIPDEILLKPGRLTTEEWDVMRLHPEHGFRMVSRIGYLKPAAEIVYSHHEKWDGSGYPRGLKNTEIPIGARIFAITDVYDALRSKRPYKDPWPLEQVIAEIDASSGTHFDPECVAAFKGLDRNLLW